jgi:hypothetical protein
MGRDDSLDVLIGELNKHFVDSIESFVVILSERGLKRGDVSDNLASFFAA